MNEPYMTKKVSFADMSITDFPTLSRLLRDRDSFLLQYLDTALLLILTDDTKETIYKAACQAFTLKKIELIENIHGETMVKPDTAIEILSDCGEYKAGDHLTVEKVTTFNENPFCQGWFLYDVKKEGCPHVSLYRGEFHVLPANENA